MSRFVGDVNIIDVLPPDIAFQPFTAVELLGTWSIDFLNRDSIGAAPHCTGGACSDLITFFVNQTAYLALSGRTASWQIDSDGNLMLSFADTGTDMSIKRLSLGNDSSTVLQAVATSTDYYISPRLMVKREVPAPSSTASLVGTMLSSAHFLQVRM